MWLNVGEIAVEDPLGAGDTDLLYRVKVFATLVVPPPWQSLRVAAMEIGVASPPNQWAQYVLAGDHRKAVSVVPP